jgi:uncharacterized membrane protein
MIWPNVLTVNLPWTLAVVLFGVFEYLMPELIRRDVMFSVRVPRAAIESLGPAVVSRYRRFLTASVLLSLTVVLTQPRLLSNWSGAVAFAAEYAGFAVALFRARREVWAHAPAMTTTREADLNAVDPPPTMFIALAIPLLCIGSVAIWTYSNWNALPDPYPIHWTMGLEPDAWVPRTPLHVYGLLGLLTGATALIAILCWGLLFWSRRRRPSRTDAATTLVIVFMLCAEYAMAAMAMLPLGFSASGTNLAIFIAIAAASICLIVTGRGGVSDESGDLARMASDPSPDSAWKLGLFYFNPDDPALFVEKRFGIGWTINLGRPWAWAFGAVVLIPTAVGITFLVAMQR